MGICGGDRKRGGRREGMGGEGGEEEKGGDGEGMEMGKVGSGDVEGWSVVEVERGKGGVWWGLCWGCGVMRVF